MAMDDLIIVTEEFITSDDDYLSSDPFKDWTRPGGSCQPESEQKDSGIVEKFKCNECDKTFGQAGDLKSHLSTIHLRKERKFVCDKCGKTFWRAGHLKAHVSIVHMKDSVSFT